MGKYFSENFRKAKGISGNSAVAKTIAELQGFVPSSLISFLNYDSFYVVRFPVNINLPSRGTVKNLDIRKKEYLLLFFDEERYPGKAPQVRVDRIDFPASNLPHLNSVPIGEPYWLCLHKGNFDDWFTEHSIKNLVDRAINWLEDAARGELIKDIDFFEPTRLFGENWVSGMSVFPHDLFANYVEKDWSTGVNEGFAYVSSYGSFYDKDNKWFRFLSEHVASSFDDIRKYNDTLEKRELEIKGSSCFGILCWHKKEKVFNEYISVLPNNYNSLLDFSKKFDINLERAISDYFVNQKTEQDIVFIPIFLCIQRPLPLQNTNSKIEILSFLYVKEKEEHILLLAHREPLSPNFANKISGFSIPLEKETYILGVGALGSKISLHLGRSGITNLKLVDNSSLAPHNLVRHSLFSDSIGVNKAYGLSNVIKNIYRDSGEKIEIEFFDKDIFSLLSDTGKKFRKTDLIIDATASIAVFERLSSFGNPYLTPVVRCEIADNGKLGIMLVEGKGRSPKIDDLRASLYDLAIDNNWVGHWLMNLKQDSTNEDIGFGLEEITIGLGCSSPTMRLSDDVISFHASAQAIAIRKYFMSGELKPGIQLTNISGDGELVSTFISSEKYKSLFSKNLHGWTVRIKSSIYDSILRQVLHYSPDETGGILVGFINFSNKTIHVTREILPSSDSLGTPYAFKLGVNDVPEKILEIQKKTGELISYVGEWHSHPNGTSSLSNVDKEAVNQLKKNLIKIGMPVFVMVATPNGCYPYIFER